MKPQKCLTDFFPAVERKIDVDMADFTFIGKKRKRLGQNFELVRWGRFRSDICQSMFYSWHVIDQWDAAEL